MEEGQGGLSAGSQGLERLNIPFKHDYKEELPSGTGCSLGSLGSSAGTKVASSIQANGPLKPGAWVKGRGPGALRLESCSIFELE